MTAAFPPGSRVLRREVLHGRLWLECPVTVVADEGDVDGGVLAVLLEPGTPFTFHEHPFGPHPWSSVDGWHGPQVLQLHRTGTAYGVWLFFDDGVFRYWYVNFEAPVVRHDGAYDTDDHGLDLIVHPDGRREWKDVADLSLMRAEGRLDGDQVLGVLDAATEVWRRLDDDDRWWAAYDGWRPPD